MRLEHVEQELLTPRGELRTRTVVNLATTRWRAAAAGRGAVAGDAALQRPAAARVRLHVGRARRGVGPAAHDRARVGGHPRRHRRPTRGAPRGGGLNATQDFIATDGPVLPKLWVWSRIRMATNDEVRGAAGLRAFEGALSVKTEDAIAAHLIQSVGGVRSTFDHGVEEDEYLLAPGARHALGVREELAVRHRRLVKLILDRLLKRVEAQFDDPATHRRRQREEEAERRRERGGGDSADGGAATAGGGGGGGYSTSKERRRQEKERCKKRAAAEIGADALQRRRTRRELASTAIHAAAARPRSACTVGRVRHRRWEGDTRRGCAAGRDAARHLTRTIRLAGDQLPRYGTVQGKSYCVDGSAQRVQSGVGGGRGEHFRVSRERETRAPGGGSLAGLRDRYLIALRRAWHSTLQIRYDR